jgi:hypothetical protein
MNPIGGYFELELHKGIEYHKGAIRLNFGRNAFEYILRARAYKKVYLPYYICDVLLEPIHKLKLKCEYYHINEQLDPIFNFKRIGEEETFIYINYFGLKKRTVQKISNSCPNLIIDNSQAFFEKPLAGIDTFYSPRKFFGVPDGAYLYCKKQLKEQLSEDESYNRMSHLLKRIDKTPEGGYSDFVRNEKELSGIPLKRMSRLSTSILMSIDYNAVKNRRIINFKYLHDHLEKYNELNIDLDRGAVPMVYPFVNPSEGLREYLISKNIYIAKYWNETIKNISLNETEKIFVNNLVALPIDQRYGEKEMATVTDKVKAWIGI